MSAPLNLTHNERFATIGESTRTVVDRIVKMWERSTPADVEAGAQWYGAGGAFIDTLAARTGYSREHVAAVVAHLSPRTPWARNLDGATALLTTGEAPGCLTANIDRARNALASSAPLKTFNGPKTAAFVHNLLGDEECVTVDVWAVRIALGDRDDAEMILARVGIYAAVEYAYQLAARRVGVSPTTMQATTWVVARGGRAA
jgi:hypothetical protein